MPICLTGVKDRGRKLSAQIRLPRDMMLRSAGVACSTPVLLFPGRHWASFPDGLLGLLALVVSLSLKASFRRLRACPPLPRIVSLLHLPPPPPFFPADHISFSSRKGSFRLFLLRESAIPAGSSGALSAQTAQRPSSCLMAGCTPAS